MKKIIYGWAALCLLAGLVSAQDRVDITSFEEGLEWGWTGGAFQGSFVDDVGNQAQDGSHVLVVIYDNGGSEWQYATLNFPIGSVDLTGMREIHMWVRYSPESTGELRIRLDLPNNNILGFAQTVQPGEWSEMVFRIDRLTSANSVNSVGFFQGFITPTPGSAAGEVWIDNIYAVRPSSIPVVEEVLLYDFESVDPATGSPQGWEAYQGAGADEGQGEITPSHGNNYLTFYAGGGYAQNVRTINTLADFSRWADVVEILFDIRIASGVPGGWLQSRLHLNSGVTGDTSTDVSTQTKEIGYAETSSSGWKTMLFEVDLSSHRDNLTNPNGWFTVAVSTNNGAEADGFPIYLDNFRVAAPQGTPVSNWSVY